MARRNQIPSHLSRGYRFPPWSKDSSPRRFKKRTGQKHTWGIQWSPTWLSTPEAGVSPGEGSYGRTGQQKRHALFRRVYRWHENTKRVRWRYQETNLGHWPAASGAAPTVSDRCRVFLSRESGQVQLGKLGDFPICPRHFRDGDLKNTRSSCHVSYPWRIIISPCPSSLYVN